MPLFLLYFIILTNLYCAKTLNILLSFVTDVHFVMVLLLVSPKMWRFPYTFGFCNPVRIYGRKINDDEFVFLGGGGGGSSPQKLAFAVF
jgi:hypothetical protein